MAWFPAPLAGPSIIDSYLSFDFRSPEFHRDALWLAGQTGQALWRCRQELYIAEGQVEEALAVLRGVAPVLERGITMH